MTQDVAIVRCDSYEGKEVSSALEKAMDLCPPPDVQGKTVLLKPNILWDSPPELAITTHPEIVRGAVQLFFRRGAARVLVGDSPGLHSKSFPTDSCGIREAAESAGAEWIDFNGEKTTLPVPGARRVKKFTLTRAVEEADLIVSLPKMKTHTLMYYTGAMKNLFGLVPGTLKASFHARYPGQEAFASVMIDLNAGLKTAAYALMDGVIGLEGPGPGKAGKPKRMALILASDNLLAMDLVASGLMGYDAPLLPMNREALRRGLWLKNAEDLAVKGLSLEEAKPEHFETVPLPRRRSNLLNYLTTSFSLVVKSQRRPKPTFDHRVCIRCGKCIEICPAGALSYTGTGSSRLVLLNEKACVRCYCCHEICPVGAISVGEHPPQ
ncbi:MAG: DUF362 domain-containing protein [Spirochaetales bacterium]|nr:DUF362 domain-containing protein [Spirochaetales bacterium]